MAVSLAQFSHEASKRRSTAYYPAEAMYMPMPEHFHQTYQQPPFQQTYLPPPPPPPQHRYQRFAHPAYHYQQLPQYQQEQPPAPPPRPPKTPIETTQAIEPPALPQRPHAASFASTIVPDPLPPHSNPQALTQTQSQAFEDSQPIPSVRIGKEEVYNSQTGFALYTITREAAHMSFLLSTKPLITVARINGIPVGRIRFHNVSSSIDLTINGRQTAISHQGFIHNRWGFQSTTCADVDDKWYWKSDKTTNGAKLEDSKKSGHVLARMNGDLLTFEQGRLSDASCDEVLLSAVAMAEAARRQKKGSDVTDLASAIGEFASSDGGSGGDGGGGGS